MKLAIVGDAHFGSHRNSEVFLESTLKYFKKQLLPDLKARGIDTIVQLGDWFDNRNNINIKVMNDVYELLENELSEFKVYVLAGNHDIYYKTSIDTHSLQMFKKFSNITVIDSIQKVTFDKLDVLLTPWIVDTNKFVEHINENDYKCDVCFGHFEMKGFSLNNKVKSQHGIDCDIFFDNYKLILSGHYHTISEQKRKLSTIKYVGSISHLTRHDIGDARGIHILDTDTLDLEFIENTTSLKYINITYPTKVTKKMIEGNNVDVDVVTDENFNEDEFQRYLANIDKMGPAFPAIPNYISTEFEEDDVEIEAITIGGIVDEYIETIKDTIKNKDAVTTKVKDLYEECKGEN